MLKEVEQVEIGIQLSSGKRVGGLLFSNDCIGVSHLNESLQKLIGVVLNVSKNKVMIFFKDAVKGC